MRSRVRGGTRQGLTGPLLGFLGVALLAAVGAAMIMGVLLPVEPEPVPTPPTSSPSASPTVVPPPPKITLRPPPPPSTSHTPDELAELMQELVAATLVAIGPVPESDIPWGIDSFPVTQSECNSGVGVQVTAELWFSTPDNDRALAEVGAVWTSLGYAAGEFGVHPNAKGEGVESVRAEGLDPLPAQHLSLERTWEPENLLLELRSLCVAG